MKKIISLILALLLTAPLLIGCGGGVRDDVTVESIATEIEKSISGSDNLSAADEDFITYQMNADPEKLGEYILKTPKSNSALDEYGIFRAKDAEQLEYIEKSVKDYLKSRREMWDDRYHQEEKPKIEGAVTKTAGTYVVYLILSEAERDSALTAFEYTLKK